MKYINKSESENYYINKINIDLIRKEIRWLDLKRSVYSGEIESYFKYYGINFKIDSHHFGYYKSLNKKLAAHIFFNHKNIGTVLLIHGYLEHSAVSFSKLIPVLLENGYCVAAVDLPGHGLSEGGRGDIRNFREYLQVIKDFYNEYLIKLPKPYHIIGHSTGCAGILNALHDNTINFDSYILAAPLIRPDLWNLTKLGMFLTGWFLKKVPVSAERGTNNKTHAEFLSNNDPLFIRQLPLSWVRALFRWEKEIKKNSINYKKIYILQGRKDKSLSWKYNVKYFNQYFPNCRIKYFPEANHCLFSEPEPVRKRIIESVLLFLGN